MPTVRLFTTLALLVSTSVVVVPGCSSAVIEASATPTGPSAPRYPDVGAPCAHDYQCASERCSADPTAGSCGICLDARRLGESCDGPQQGCSATAVCKDEICQSLEQGLGEACKLGPKGEDLLGCDSELSCDGTELPGGATEGVCTVSVGSGGVCPKWPMECAKGTFCGPEGLCVVPPVGSCRFHACDADEFCGENYLCHPATLLPGAKCGVYFDSDCAPGNVCGNPLAPNEGVGVDSTCLPLPLAGEPCVLGECAPEAFCAGPASDSAPDALPMCTQRRLVGAACNGEYSFYYYTECAAGLDCRNDTCLPACK